MLGFIVVANKRIKDALKSVLQVVSFKLVDHGWFFADGDCQAFLPF